MTRSLLKFPDATANVIPTFAETIGGVVPTLVVHRGHNHFSELPELITRAQTQVRRDAAIAVATRMPRKKPAGTRAFLDSCVTAALRIADPEIHTLAGPNQAPHAQPSADAAEYDYAKNVIPATPNPAWVKQVLDAQHAAGATVFLSASGWVSGVSGVKDLTDAMAFVTATGNELAADDPMFVNLTLHGEWLRRPVLLNALLQELVELPEKLWWLRFMWPALRPTNYVQLADRALLDGYKTLAGVAKSEKKTLFLPNSGLTGWFATALGASGFSTGMSGTERAYEDKVPQDGSSGTAKERFFERNVLHTILMSDRRPLARQNTYATCQCHYCGRLRVAYSRKDEHLHYLYNAATLTAALGPNARRVNARTLVHAASSFNQALPAAGALVQESSPRHLDDWSALI
jgi:hypothetical protein